MERPQYEEQAIATEDAADENASAPNHRRDLGRVSRALSFRNISAVYVFIVLFVLFSFWVPDTFLSGDTWRALISSQAVTAMLSVGLVIALSAGAFDLAIGATLGFGSIFVAWLLAKHGIPIVPAIVLSIVAGAAVGLLNGLLVVRVRIDSFIATLGMSSILLAMIAWISSSQQILGLSNSFQKLGTTEIFGLTLPVYLMLAVALGCCGAIAAFSGVLVSSALGTGDPTIGPAYLLPAFSAAFLGSTQFRGGRFNIWGTVLAVYVLATGVKGLQLAGAPIWIPDLFNGVALLVAVGLAKYQGTARRAGAVKRLLRFDRQ